MLVMPLRAEAGIIAGVLSPILEAIVYVLGGLVVTVVWVMVKVAEYNGFINSAPVGFGWVIIRDICNMFFVVILLIIAIASILKIESYNYKKLLPKVVLMAVLINFSKIICGAALDLAQIVMMTFVNGFKDVGPGNFMMASGLDKLLSFKNGSGDITELTIVTDMKAVGVYFMALFYLVVLLIVLIIMTLVLVFRIVMLWFLVLLSPLFFLLLSFPSGMTYAKQWSSQFVKYTIIGPILAFFIWVSMASFGTIAGGTQLVPVSDGSEGNIQGGGEGESLGVGVGVAGSPSYFATFIICSAMLIAGLIITGQMGVAGGTLASGAVGKMKTIGGKVATWPAGFGLERGWGVARRRLKENKYTAWMTKPFWEGVGEYSKDLEAKADKRAGARGSNFWEEIWKGKEGSFDAMEMAEKEIEAMEEKKLTEKMGGDLNLETIVEGMNRTFDDKSSDGFSSRTAMVQLAAKVGNYDDGYYNFVKIGRINQDENDKGYYKNWGFDSWEQAKQFNDITAKILAMKFVGLEREKFDPEKIKEKYLANEKINLTDDSYFKDNEYKTAASELLVEYLPQAVQDKKRAATEEELLTAKNNFLKETKAKDWKDYLPQAVREGKREVTEKEKETAEHSFEIDQEKFDENGKKMLNEDDKDVKTVLRETIAGRMSELERDQNVRKATEKEKRALWSLVSMTQNARGVGHWEQSVALKDPENDGLPKILSDREKFNYISGESQKIDIGELRKKFATHNIVGRNFNESIMDWEIDNEGWNKMTATQKKVFMKILGTEFSAELHRGQTRFPRHLLRMNDWVNKDTGEFSEEGWGKFKEMRKYNPRLMDAAYKFLIFGREKGTHPFDPEKEKSGNETREQFNKRIREKTTKGLNEGEKKTESSTGSAETKESAAVANAEVAEKEVAHHSLGPDFDDDAMQEAFDGMPSETLEKLNKNIEELSKSIDELKKVGDNKGIEDLAKKMKTELSNAAKSLTTAGKESFDKNLNAATKGKNGLDQYENMDLLFKQYLKGKSKKSTPKTSEKKTEK